jgi:hypothetical protein
LIAFVFMFLAVILGAVGHAIYRRTQQPWKFMISHRIFGPAAMGLGTANCISGFRFAGYTRPIIGFIVVVVVIWVAILALVLLRRRKQMRKTGPMNTPAAMNFREGQAQQQSGWYGQQPGVTPQGHGPAIPLQNYQQPGAPPMYK